MTPQDFIKKYEQALATQQWHKVAPLIHEQACVTFTTGTYKGKAEVQKVFEHNFAAIQDEQYHLSNLHWAFVDEHTAVCLYQFHWQGLINGQPASGAGRGTSVLVQQDNQWLLVSEHLGPL